MTDISVDTKFAPAVDDRVRVIKATKRRITQVAADLIFEHGVAGTSIEDVRKAAAVSGSQMTHYFADKRSLVRAVVALQCDSVVELHQLPVLGERIVHRRSHLHLTGAGFKCGMLRRQRTVWTEETLEMTLEVPAKNALSLFEPAGRNFVVRVAAPLEMELVPSTAAPL